MVQIYVRRIRNHKMTLQNVPVKWREKVRIALEEGET